MKKYYPVDFDEKGKAILGEARNTPTSNSFIPTTWAPGGGGEDEGNGIKSISISPSITTIPALDTLFPLYWDDLEESEIQYGTDGHRNVNVQLVGSLPEGMSTVTVTPTSDWKAYNNNDSVYGDYGEPEEAYPVEWSENPEFEVTVWNGDESDEGSRQIKLTVHVNE